MTLPFAPPLEPMLAKLTPAIPEGDGWLFEPKWDGFRCLVFRDESVFLQSRDSRPLGRYFPEVEAGLRDEIPPGTVLDGEIVIAGPNGLDFGALQLRLHPAASRVQKLAAETPASFVAFDLLAWEGEDLRAVPFGQRRDLLGSALGRVQPPVYLTPATKDRAIAEDWFHRFEGAGFDGVIAKRLDGQYEPGVRAMLKIKHLRTADCVVGGFRWYKGMDGTAVGSLLLGLYDERGVLHHTGHTASFDAAARKELKKILEPLVTNDDSEGFGGGRTPGAPSRWNAGKDVEWIRVRPELVCEVTFDYLQGDRFRHAATFQRWRPDRDPRTCTYAQLETVVPAELRDLFGT